MRVLERKRLLLRLAAGFAITLPASAQSEAKAAAVSAYDEAERLMQGGQVADACVKYAESQRLDAQLGTLLHLADCMERNGQTASAWAGFREAADLAEQRADPRRELARQRIENLEGRLSRIEIDPPAGADPSLLHIERDSVVVGSGLWRAPVPADPGPHTITASAPGRRPWRTTAIVRSDGSTTVVQVPELEPEVPKSPEASTSPDTAPNASASARPTEQPRQESNGALSRRWPALAAGGVGLVGIGIGTVFGLQSKSKRDQAESHCDGRECTDQRGVDLRQEALTAGNLSTLGFVVGGIGLTAATVLWFTLDSSDQPRGTRVGLGVGNVNLEGRW